MSEPSGDGVSSHFTLDGSRSHWTLDLSIGVFDAAICVLNDLTAIERSSSLYCPLRLGLLLHLGNAAASSDLHIPLGAFTHLLLERNLFWFVSKHREEGLAIEDDFIPRRRSSSLEAKEGLRPLVLRLPYLLRFC